MRYKGYRQARYAHSLREFGTVRPLTGSGGWLLSRPVPVDPHLCDAIGCYPIMACSDWAALPDDIDALDDLVSVSFVTDPFADMDAGGLARRMTVMRPYKDHLVLDLSLDPTAVASKHHRYYARRALRDVTVEVAPRPVDLTGEWCALYDHLVERHAIEGIRSFSTAAFAEQLQLDGLTAIVAREAGLVVAAHLWLMQDDVAHSHLAASSPRGYEVSASYALYKAAIDHFRGRAAWMSFGAGAGVHGGADDGLTRFKRGWSSGTRPSFFCGKVLHPQRYAALSQGRADDFFPAYRSAL